MFSDELSVTIFAAVLSAFVALVALIHAKENKISEFRQAWVDGLRSDISEGISAAATLTVVMQDLDKDTRAQFLSEWARLFEVMARIELRLNLKKVLHQRMNEHIQKTKSLLNKLQDDPDDYDQGDWLTLQTDLISASQALLKFEWDRVKRGEIFYRATRWTLGIVVGLGTGAAGIAAYLPSP
jgi:hypothetical protein